MRNYVLINPVILRCIAQSLHDVLQRIVRKDMTTHQLLRVQDAVRDYRKHLIEIIEERRP